MPKDMCRVEGGEFAMGSADFYPEERPVHRVRVPGSLVFRKPPGPVPLDDVRRWWQWTPGADWRHPYGPDSILDGLDRHPVTHVAYDDAAAHAAWAGKTLPSEAEWEYAARGGLEGAVFAWGDDAMPKGRPMANTWQGRFPWENLRVDGYEGTSPIKAFPPNRYGLYDMTGNVWEWTDDFFTAHANATANPCCVPHNPRHHTPDATVGAGAPGAHLPRRVIKGGSHLCAPNYCLRYRPAARQAETVDTSTCHIGFRCIIRDAPGA